MMTVPALPVAMVAPGPTKSPALAATVVDLRTREGAGLVSGVWRYTDARVVEATNRLPGADDKPGGVEAPTHDLSPRLGSPEFDAAAWEAGHRLSLAGTENNECHTPSLRRAEGDNRAAIRPAETCHDDRGSATASRGRGRRPPKPGGRTR